MGEKISVILPVFNRSASLKEAIGSVLNQSYPNFELIIVDDASTEDIESIVREIPDDRIRFIRREKNGGASAARNTGLAVAQGEYIAFQDSDDLWLPNKLENQLRLLTNLPQNVGVVTGGKIMYGRGDNGEYGPGKVTYLPPPEGQLSLDENQERRFLVENRISLQNALFRRNCYPNEIWFDERARANADWAFTSSLAQYTKIFEVLEPVVLAFSSEDSVSKNTRLKAIGLIRVLKRNRSAFKKYKREYGKNLWRLGRMLMGLQKPRQGLRFCIGGFIRYPFIILDIIKLKIGLKV